MFEVQEVTPVDMAFGGDVKKLMPPMDSIPEEFKTYGGTRWNEIISRWFFVGIKIKNAIPAEGVDAGKALNHIKAIIGSFEPKHEHKEAACAFLLSEWFSVFEIEAAKQG